MELPELEPGFVFVTDEHNNFIMQENKFLIYNTTDESQQWICANPVTTEATTVCEPSLQQSNKNAGYQWGTEETYLFISLLEKQANSESKATRKDRFQEMSNEMKTLSKGKYCPTGVQCDNRYKSLLKKYKDIRDHNNKSGNGAVEWEFFEIVDKIFGKKANVAPVASCSSVTLQQQSAAEINNAANILRAKLDNQDKRKHEEGTPCSSKKKKRSTTSKVRSELLEYLKTENERQTDQQEARLELLKQQHEEIKSMFQQVLDNLK